MKMINTNSTRDEVLDAVAENAFELFNAHPDIQADREIILTALAQNGYILHSLPEDLKNDEEIVLAAVKQQGLALQYASKELRKNERVVLAALAQNGMALKFVLEPLRSKIEIVLAAVSQNGYALQYVPEFKDNKDVVTAAVAQQGDALPFASEDFQKDENLVELSQFGTFPVLNLLLPLKEKLRNEKNPDLIPAMTTMISSIEAAMVTCRKEFAQFESSPEKLESAQEKFISSLNSAIEGANSVLEQQTGWRKMVDDCANRIIDFFKSATKNLFSKKEASPQEAELPKTEASKSRFSFFANPSPVKEEVERLQQTFTPPAEPPQA